MTGLVRMCYFGAWAGPGHYFFNERGHKVWLEAACHPFVRIDGVLQPGCYLDAHSGHWRHRGPEIEGEALLHHKAGWTALSFWDRSIDKRGACNSTYIAEGLFTFDEMVQLAKARFAYRWEKMAFPVFLSGGGQ